MLKLLKYLRGYRRESITGPLFKLTEAVFELIIPLVIASMIDTGIAGKDIGYILWMGLIMILLGVLGLLCSLTAQYFAAKAAAGFGTKLRNDLMEQINRFSYTELDRMGTAALITGITNDTHQVQTSVNLALRLFLRAPFIVVGAVIMAFTVHPGLAVIFVLLVPVLCIAVFGIMFLGLPVFRKVQSKLSEVLLIVRENLTGARVVRSFAREDDENKNFRERNNQLKELQLRAGKVSGLLGPISIILVNAAVLLVLWSGSTEVESGNLTQGQLVALLNYMMQILAALVAFAFLIMSITKGFGAAARVVQILEVEPTIIPEPGNHKEIHNSTVVELKNISFAYAGAKLNALRGISLRISRGQTVGIIGGTGAGKSTLIQLITGFYPVKEGKIWVNTKKIGVVPQQAVLFAGTVRENMRWGKADAQDEEIWNAMEAAQAKKFIEDKGEGLDFLLTGGGKNLSGGQRQRLTIARALVGEPELLIMDDSVSALDAFTERKVRESLKTKAKRLTVLLISQRVKTIMNADILIVMEEGKIIGAGSHEELIGTCPVYEEICGSQLSGERREVTS